MKKQLFVFVVGLVLSGLLSPLTVFAQANNQLTAKVKTEIESIGVGPKITIRLQNKKKLTGNINRINSDDFIFSEVESGKEQTISYKDVTQVKRFVKRGIPTGVKATVIVVGILFVLSLIGNGFGG